MKNLIALILAAGSFLLSGCAGESSFPKSTPEATRNGEPEVHTPVVGMTTVTPKTDADNPY